MVLATIVVWGLTKDLSGTDVILFIYFLLILQNWSALDWMKSFNFGVSGIFILINDAVLDLL